MANGQQIGDQNFAKFTEWVSQQTNATFRQIARRGALSRKAIAEQCGIGQSALSQNPRIKEALCLLEIGLVVRGILLSATSEPNRGQQITDDTIIEGHLSDTEQIKLLTEKCESLTAENVKLEKELERFVLFRDMFDLTGRIPR
jgi:hypothetical protein